MLSQSLLSNLFILYFSPHKSRCASPVLAYSKAKEIVDNYSQGKEKVKQIEFENAKSSLTSSLLSRWESKSGAIGDTYQSWLYLQTGGNSSSSSVSVAPSTAANAKRITTALSYRLGLISRIQKVTIQDVLQALDEYLCPLFNLNNVCFAIATPNQQCEDVANSFGMKDMVKKGKIEEESKKHYLYAHLYS